ncbi:hypothetical protein Tco_1098743 [Tanacetum coccineum]
MHPCIAWDKVDNPRSQSTPQVLPSFEEYTPPVTYLKDVDKTIGILMEFPSVDEPEPQPLPNLLFLDVNLGVKRGTNPPINPYSLGSFRMKVIFDEKKLGRLLCSDYDEETEYNEFDEEVESPKLVSYVLHYPYNGLLPPISISVTFSVAEPLQICYKAVTDLLLPCVLLPPVSFSDAYSVSILLLFCH